MKKLALVLLVACGGCHDAYSNFNIVYLKSLPRELRVDVPGTAQDATTHALRTAQEKGTPARFHADTVRGADDVNRTVEQIFALIDQIVQAIDPVVEEDNTRIWGPIPIDDQNELALVITRIQTSTVMQFVDDRPEVVTDEYFDYALLVRPMGGSDDDWKPGFGGRSVIVQGARFGTGALYIDLAVTSGGDEQGLLAMQYDSRDQQSSVVVAWDADRATLRFEADAAWKYNRRVDGSGDFLLYLRQNIGDSSPRLETMVIGSRWLPTNHGRADVVVTGGDLGPLTFFASECWDPGFVRSYFESNVPEFAPLRTGMIQDCAEGLREPNFPD